VDDAMIAKDNDQCAEGPLPNVLSVICGTVDILEGTETNDVQERNVSRIFIHPEYSATALTNDIAVLVLEKPISITEMVSPACLPQPGEVFDADTPCVAIGHGKDGPDDSTGYPIYSKQLAEVGLPLWSRVSCQEELNSRHFQPKHDITWRAHKSHLCAGGEEGRDTCTGDGGGPLFCAKKVVGGNIVPEENEITAGDFGLRTSGKSLTLVQSGITAWGIGCGMAGLPAVYSDLASAACWIDQVMSCYQHEENLSALVNLRTQGAPASLNKFTESECSAWLDNPISDKGACGCSQRLSPNAPTPNAADFDVRSTDDDILAGLSFDQ